MHFNSQAMMVLLASLCREEYNMVRQLQTMKKICDALKMVHKNDKITKMEVIEGELR
jgi:hypothetical protein